MEDKKACRSGVERQFDERARRGQCDGICKPRLGVCRGARSLRVIVGKGVPWISLKAPSLFLGKLVVFLFLARQRIGLRSSLLHSLSFAAIVPTHSLYHDCPSLQCDSGNAVTRIP